MGKWLDRALTAQATPAAAQNPLKMTDSELPKPTKAPLVGLGSAYTEDLGEKQPTVDGQVLAWLVAQPERRGEFDPMCEALGWETLEQRTAAAERVMLAAVRGVIRIDSQPEPDGRPGPETLQAYPDDPPAVSPAPQREPYRGRPARLAG